jgi:hypothetical protein
MTTRVGTRAKIALAIFAGIGLFAAANAHLIWKSVSSQPDCVPHLKAPGAEGQFRAAQSSC